MEIEYCLTAKVDGVEVYRQTTESVEVIEMSLETAANSVDQAVQEVYV